jgi:hypothetical protein
VEPHTAGQHDCRAHELTTVRGGIVGEIGTGAQGKCVRESYDAGVAAELSDQHAGVGLVPLPRLN